MLGWGIYPKDVRFSGVFPQEAGIYLRRPRNDQRPELLQQYVRQKSEEAFTALVERHLNLVYSAALRQIRSRQLAEEVVKSVFIDLARQAQRLAPNTILTAWLYQVTRRTTINVIRREARRQMREQIASELTAMNATTSDWRNLKAFSTRPWTHWMRPIEPRSSSAILRTSRS